MKQAPGAAGPRGGTRQAPPARCSPNSPRFDLRQSPPAARGPQVLQETCFRCGAGEADAVLFPCRTKGLSKWVCVRCLPPLIHG